MDWLNNFQQEMKKPPDYAERTLAAYQLGMRAKGSIVGVRVLVGKNCCSAAKELATEAIYQPDSAPHLPLPGCSFGDSCSCVYRPVMAYEVDNSAPDDF